MKDTPEAVQQRFRQLIMQRSGEERLKMGCSMHQTAKALVLIRRALRYAPDDDLLRHALLNHIRRMEEKITDERLR